MNTSSLLFPRGLLLPFPNRQQMQTLQTLLVLLLVINKTHPLPFVALSTFSSPPYSTPRFIIILWCYFLIIANLQQRSCLSGHGPWRSHLHDDFIYSSYRSSQYCQSIRPRYVNRGPIQHCTGSWLEQKASNQETNTVLRARNTVNGGSKLTSLALAKHPQAMEPSLFWSILILIYPISKSESQVLTKFKI